jgi:hypothetical protein
MVAFTAVSSAMPAISFGHSLQQRAKDSRQRMFMRTRRRFARARIIMKQRTKPAFDLIARVRAA